MKHYCVPLCYNNSSKNRNLQFYRILRDKEVRKRYIIAVRNDNLKVEAENTRICSVHFIDGKKAHWCDVPSIFPWTKAQRQRKPQANRTYVTKPQAVEIPQATNEVNTIDTRT
uniref:THAP domain-containing protein 11-like n=1 Tax=Saccoglossus kowalevskii TaxID=10224 RepID=A0ABM0MI87_SACKO|nr:PREDICTED: THAP domain-containing protein 11-like [Saccoglossus kowalevskii]